MPEQKHSMFSNTPDRLAVLLEVLSLQASDAIARLHDPKLPPCLRQDLQRVLERIEFDRDRIRRFAKGEH